MNPKSLSKKRAVFFTTSVLVFTVGILVGRFSKPHKIVTIGDYTLTDADIACRDAVIKTSFPNESRNLGLSQLVKSYQHAQILKNHGYEITPDKIKAEKERIDRASLMPEKLTKIKSACGGDGPAYEKAFIVPTLADRTIYFDFFLNNKDIHRESFERAYSWKEKVIKSPSSFRNMAEEEKIVVNQLKVSASRGIELVENQPEPRADSKNLQEAPEAIRKRFDSDQKATALEGTQWIEEIIKPLRPGEISAKVIDQRETWAVIKLIGKDSKDKDAYVVESALFPKRDYRDWLSAEKQKVNVSNSLL